MKIRAQTLAGFVPSLLLFVSGCLVGPDYLRPAEPAPPWGELEPAAQAGAPPPAEASRVVTEPIAATWWSTFEDPQLTSLIERAVKANLDVAQAEARVRQTRASRSIASSTLWPQLESSGSYLRNRPSKQGPNPNAPGNSWDGVFTAGFDANWEIDVFGGIRRGVEAAEARVEAAEADREAILVTLFGDVGFEYVSYRSLQQRIAIASDNLKSQQATLDLTRRLFDAGLVAELDVTRAAAQVATTASAIPVLQQQAAQAVHRLGVLLGEPPMALRAELAPVRPVPRAPDVVSVGLPSELLLRRPDIARSERELAAATAEIGVARADLFPRFFIIGAAGLQSIGASDFVDWGSRFASIGPRVNWPVFEGGAIRANIALQTAAQQELFAAHLETVLQAFREVEDALVAFAGNQAANAQLEEAVRADARAAELARQLYAQGLTDFLTVLVAEETLFSAQDSLAQSQRDIALELVALYKAVGGGWQVAGPVTASGAP